MEQALNRHDFDVGYANHPYFVSPFSALVMQTELPRGWKVPKITKFFGEAGKSNVDYVAHYQIECGCLTNNEDLNDDGLS